MRMLVGFDGNIAQWRAVPGHHADAPALPLVYPFGQAFVKRGHSLVGLQVTGNAVAQGDPFERVYPLDRMREALGACDVALLWSWLGIRATLLSRFCGGRPPVLLASYVWRSSGHQGWKVRFLEAATRFTARLSAGTVLMTEHQCDAARNGLGDQARVVRFTCGLDLEFYESATDLGSLPGELRSALERIAEDRFVIVAGDQLRFDEDVLSLVGDHGLRVVRVVQEVATADRYRCWIAERRLEDRCFILNRIPYVALRWLLQHASAYAGVVDSSWQPAGWTVACEALAAGTPVVLYEGLVSSELRRLGAAEKQVLAVHPRDVRAMARAVARLISNPLSARDRVATRDFARQALDQRTWAEELVAAIEEIWRQIPQTDHLGRVPRGRP